MPVVQDDVRSGAVTFVSLYVYINPIIAVGVLLLGEPFNIRIAAAAALVLAGVAIVRSPAVTAARAPAVDTPRRVGFVDGGKTFKSIRD